MHFFWWTIKGESTLGDSPAIHAIGRLRDISADQNLTERHGSGWAKNSIHSDVGQWNDGRIGLTALYNLVHDEAVQDEDIVRLREIHVEIDEAVREAYALDEEREPAIREYEAKVASAPLPSWREIELGHGFHETRQGVRFTISRAGAG